MSELKAISGHEIREDIDYNTRGVDLEDKEWRKYGKELCDTLYYLKSEADKLIAEKDAIIVELQAKNKRLEEIKDKYSSCAEKAINNIAKCELKIRSLSRALWLSRLRSLRNFSVLAYFQTIRAKGKESNMDFDEMAYRINLACVKCRNKAEEYK